MTGRQCITLCVTNYNGEAYLEETLSAAVERAGLFVEILLVDNGSDDGSLELVRRRFPAVRVVALGENRGASAARNRGWREAVSDRVLFLDNDVRLCGQCVERLSAALDAGKNAVAAMPSVLYANDPGIVQYDGAGCHYLGLMSIHNGNGKRANQDKRTRSIDSLITACFLADRTRWGDGDPFDENLFIYLEDHDFGMRIRLRGGEILSVPEASCLHREGTEGLSLRKTGRYTPVRLDNLIRNRWQIIAKNYSVRTLALFAPVFLVYELCQFSIVVARGWLGSWTSSVEWMIANRADLRERRAAVQGSRAVPDREFLEGGPIPFADQLAESGPARLARGALDAFSRLYWNLVRRAL